MRLILGFFLLLLPAKAWAFVPHAYDEVYIHQMGHVFFVISCIFIMWVISIIIYRAKGVGAIYFFLNFFLCSGMWIRL